LADRSLEVKRALKGKLCDLQEDSPAQAPEASRSHSKYQDHTTYWENEVGQGALALGLQHKKMGMGVGALECLKGSDF